MVSSVSSAFGSAIAGLTSATKNIDKAAQDIADPTKGIGSDGGVDDIVDLSVNAQAFKANLNVIKTTDEMQQNLLDILT